MNYKPQIDPHFKAAPPDAEFFDDKKKRSLHSRLFFFIPMLLLILLLVNSISNMFIHVAHTTIPVTGLEEALDGFTILQISDLKGFRAGKNQSRFRTALSGVSFDAVVMTGDLISELGNSEPLYELVEVLKSLNADAPIYIIAGDSDPLPASISYSSGGSPFAPWVLGLRQRGGLLLSHPQYIQRASQKIWFLSLTQLTLDASMMETQYEEAYLTAVENEDENEIELAKFNLSAIQESEKAQQEITEEDVVIGITHVPPLSIASGGNSYRTKALRPRLILAGHYLGGLMRLPLIGALFIPSSALPLYGLFPGEDYLCGLTSQDGIPLYISNGCGSSDSLYPSFFFRLCNPPTVTLHTLVMSSI